MNEPAQSTVKGPHGTLLTLADLPPPGTTRWVIRRKAELIAAVRGGLLSMEEACSRYKISVEEFMCWEHRIREYGYKSLRVTRTQLYLKRDESRVQSYPLF